MAESSFEMRKTKYRDKLLEEIQEEFRDMHDKNSLTADVERALEFALDMKELRDEKLEEIEEKEEELEDLKKKWMT